MTADMTANEKLRSHVDQNLYSADLGLRTSDIAGVRLRRAHQLFFRR